VKFERTHKLGCEAFDAFKKHYPDYDPENLVSLCSKEPVIVVTPTAAPVIAAPPKLPDFKLPLLEWCDIPEGTLEIDLPSQNGGEGKKKVDVPAFKISRYPITNEQYKIFLDDEMGYANKKWWQFSPEGEEWRTKNPEPQPPTFRGEERPRERVNWFDAMAFCQWLSMKLGMNITLPTDVQWIRAAQGDDKRAFPWGNTFDKQKCNTRESEIKMTTLVMRYPSGASPFGVYDMAGNVWEWCQDLHVEAGSNGDTAAATKRLVHGGSFISPCQRAEIGFRYYLDPHSFHSTIGFRVIATNNPA
jgi:formylglycine-generating enzyme required for sulfatase activity